MGDSGGLMWSIKNGDVEQVKAIVEKEGTDVNADLSGGRAPVHYAGDMGQTEVMQYLVEKGADVNKKDVHGITALLAAVWEGHTETVKFLLSAGADKTQKAPDGSSYVDCAETPELKALLK
eukprot:m.477354 g.477354  ORF g.477354 m.477354 type:complete len:121 (+) comp20813_c0_seq1:117-479(+)